MSWKMELPVKSTGLNDYVRSCRTNPHKAANFVKTTENEMSRLVEGVEPYRGPFPVVIHFTWTEKDMRRDADNIAFGKKFILDTLVKCKIIPNDSRQYIVGFTDRIVKGDRYNVSIEIEPAQNVLDSTIVYI